MQALEDSQSIVAVPVTGSLVISPNEVFGDIMVLASPPRPCLPVDPDDVNALTRQIFNGSLSKFI